MSRAVPVSTVRIWQASAIAHTVTVIATIVGATADASVTMVPTILMAMRSCRLRPRPPLGTSVVNLTLVDEFDASAQAAAEVNAVNPDFRLAAAFSNSSPAAEIPQRPVVRGKKTD
jgi:hypothetical protein